MNEARYLFDSSGGCARCDAMDGYYEERPQRPHPHCDCVITREEILSDYQNECFAISVETEDAEANFSHDVSPVEYRYELTYRYLITCFTENKNISDLLTYTGAVVVEQPSDSGLQLLEELLMDGLEQARQDVLEIAERECRCEISPSLTS